MTAEEALKWFEEQIPSVDAEERIAAIKMLLRERDALLAMVEKYVEAATPYFQSGGKYAHWLAPGDNIVVDGIRAAIKAYEDLRDSTARD